jgi:hypothetical protein
MQKRWLFVAAVGAGALTLALAEGPQTARAADHLDGPAAQADKTTDINDVYAWMENGKLVVAVNVFPVADATSEFSDAAWYVIHVNSAAAYGMAQTETTIICGFDAAQSATCWFGDDAAEIVQGDASAAAGLATASGKAKVFAGLREDPFFFNLGGFNDTRAAVVAAAGGLTFDAAGCPAVDAATSAALVGMLQGSNNGAGAAVDFFASLNTLSIVVELDASLVNAGGPVLGVWASTHAK